ncbi:unnamed protein product [Rhizophagus irregularis]|nr:unnamed protein product [Rhizophagus irregularis]
MNSNNLNEDFYQTAINYYGIKEILENFGNEKERIGQGSCIVYKTKCESLGGILIAIKEVNITSDDCKNRTIKTFVNELKIYNRIDNGRIIQFYGISRNVKERLYYLVLEYANQGNLREYINVKNCNENGFEWTERVFLATQIAEGLCYLHDELNIAHRDLHTKNILINDEEWRLYLDICHDLKEELIKGTPIDYMKIYTNCWQSEPDFRPLISQILLQLQSMSLEPIFEGDDDKNSIYLLPPSDTSKNSISGYSPSLSSLAISENLASSFLSTNTICKKCEIQFKNYHWCRDEPYSDYEIDNEDELILDIINGVRPNDVIGTPKCYHELMQKCLDADPEKRPTTLNLLEELHAFTTAPFKKHQFEAADRRVRGQPLGTRPSQLTKDNVKIVVESINVAEAYVGTTSFRFTNRSLRFDFSLPEPKNAIEKSLYFNGEGLLDE